MNFLNKIQSHHLFYMLFSLLSSIFHSNSFLKKHVIECEFRFKRAQLYKKKSFSIELKI